MLLLTVPASSPAAHDAGRARLPPGVLPPLSSLTIEGKREFSLVHDEEEEEAVSSPLPLFLAHDEEEEEADSFPPSPLPL